MGEDAQRLLALLLTHGAAELILVELRDRARQQRMIGFALERFLGVARHIEAGRTGGAEHQIDPLQRHIGRAQRIRFPGQRQRLLFVHRHNGDVVAQKVAPELRVVADDILRAQRQHHRHVVAFRVLNRLQGGLRHRLAFAAAHQVRGEHQRRRAGDDRFGNAFGAQLVHLPGTDGEGTFALLADQGKAAANGAVDALQIVEIDPAGGVAEVAIGVTADLNIAAHHAEQHRPVIGQHRVVVQRIADGAAGELMANQVIAQQLVVERFGNVVGDH